MEQTKFIQLLQTLSKVEFNQFERYLTGLYGSYDLANMIFTYVKKYHPDYPADKLDIDKLITKKKSPFYGLEKKPVQNELSKLYNWLKEFLVWKKMTGQQFCYEKEKLEIEVLQKQGLHHHAQKNVQAIGKIINKHKESTAKNFHLMNIYEFTYYENYQTNKLNSKTKSLSLMQKSLEDASTILHYKIGCEWLNRQLVLQENHLEKINKIAQITVSQNFTNKLLECYYRIFELLSTLIDEEKYKNSKSLYEQTSKFIKENHEEIIKSEARLLILNLFNYLLNAQKLGIYETLHDHFDLIKFGIEKEIIIEDVIPPTHFLNYVHIPCRAGYVNWAKQFIEGYLKKVQKTHRKDTELLSLATIHFENGQWDEVLDVLTHVDMRDPDFGIRVRWFLLATYYEHPTYNNNPDFFSAFCNAFWHYLSRQKKLNKNTLNGSKNLIRIVEKMYDKKFQSQKELRDTIIKTNPLFFQQWLLSKVATYKPL